MERKSWKVDLNGAQHAVALDWTYFGGRREVTLDRELVSESTIPMRWRSEQTFQIDGHPAVVRTKPARRLSPWFVISLEVDGATVPPEPGKSRWEA